MDEANLIRRAKKGNMAAFQRLVEIYAPVVERFAYQLGNRPHEVEDIAQEVFIRVYRFLGQYQQAKFSTWLYKITLNTTRDLARKKTQYDRKVVKLKQDRQTEESCAAAEESVLQSEQDRILHQCVQSLDEKYRVPLVLYYFQDRKYNEIAEIMQVSLATVKTRMFRAKELLKQEIKKSQEGSHLG
ncbi:sigma-70 family RNA polymerase sigma factor [Bacillaceae bacterium SIJ1]|uniref:RNA polymerase sigma factor n=1 Tax=Litoribacterium kuwaitense TaxID=1398745 RepID=UPI0013EC0781|nr:sigma-70 family RNA polymerase sigma factor [Litoribacterium kuwaitense]NGP44292.1 sigma-70 family RNA polymerase sigma factor [Litoribacterium kuwaitense]